MKANFTVEVDGDTITTIDTVHPIHIVVQAGPGHEYDRAGVERAISLFLETRERYLLSKLDSPQETG